MIEQIFLGRLKILPKECSSWLSGLDVPAQKKTLFSLIFLGGLKFPPEVFLLRSYGPLNTFKD